MTKNSLKNKCMSVMESVKDLRTILDDNPDLMDEKEFEDIPSITYDFLESMCTALDLDYDEFMD